MKSMSASHFKARCLAVLDEVERTGESVLILKRGRPVARLGSAAAAQRGSPRNRLAGTATVVGDIVSPPLPTMAWKANRGRGP
jgi:prevent-host-death family protein